MISTKPTVAEIDAAMNLLSILEMAKDASALKATLAGIKDQQAALAEQRELAAKDLETLAGGQLFLEEQQARLDADREKLRQENDKHIRNTADLAADRAAMKEERNRFDAWMAKEREEFDRLKARVSSDAAANNTRAAQLEARNAELDKREADLASARAAADAKRVEYEQKLESLKAMVS